MGRRRLTHIETAFGKPIGMSTWRETRNAASKVRLERALPKIFPAVVLQHALRRSLIPPLPRLAVESYWRAHPLRADRIARALARRSGTPEGWHWRLIAEPRAAKPTASGEIGETDGVEEGVPRSFRIPPAPYRESAFSRGPGHCCLCGQRVFRFGWHEDLWHDGKPNTRARWHACCVAAWKFWTVPQAQLKILKRVQKHKCRETGQRLPKTAEVDHRVPLFRVWRAHRDLAWPALLDFWGLPNLQVVGRRVHAEKTAKEAGERGRLRAPPDQPARATSARYQST